MDFDEPVNENSPHFVIDFDLSLHVIRVHPYCLIHFYQVLEDISCILGTILSVLSKAKVAKMEIAGVACQSHLNRMMRPFWIVTLH